METITVELAQKVLDVVDCGLVLGLGEPEPGKMCVEAAVCYAMGLPHGDQPSCVAPSLCAFKIGLNDAAWSSNAARSTGLRRLAIAQLGSAGKLDEAEFVTRLARLAKAWAAEAAAWAAEADAWEAAEAAAWAARDKVLAGCAEDVVQLLIEMKAPGCAYLYLT